MLDEKREQGRRNGGGARKKREEEDSRASRAQRIFGGIHCSVPFYFGTSLPVAGRSSSGDLDAVRSW
jgi:hypothetical protein